MLLALKTLWVGQVVVTLNIASLAVTPAPIGPPTLTFGEFDVEGITTLTSIAIRPTTPAVLGDEQAHTASGVVVGPSTGSAGTTEIMATEMEDAEPGAIGSIQHVVFHCIGYIPELGPYAMRAITDWPAPPPAPNTRMAWKVGGIEDESALISDDPTIGTGIAGNPDPPFTPIPTVGWVFKQEDDGVDAGDPLGLNFFLHTANVTTQPNGNPWTWQAINDLVDVAVRYDFPAGVSGAELAILEIWVEVFGQGGGAGSRRKIKVKLGMGSPMDALILGMPVLRLAPPVIEEVGLTIGLARQKLSLSGPMSFTLVMA